MDFVVELLVQFVVQVVFELLGQALIELGFRGPVALLRNRVARVVVATVLGLGFGLLWGHHLDGGEHWPKLLWVSLLLAVCTAVLAAGRPWEGERTAGWDKPLALPWDWSTDRLLSFVLLNLAIAAGIALAFRPAG